MNLGGKDSIFDEDLYSDFMSEDIYWLSNRLLEAEADEKSVLSVVSSSPTWSPNATQRFAPAGDGMTQPHRHRPLG